MWVIPVFCENGSMEPKKPATESFSPYMASMTL